MITLHNLHPSQRRTSPKRVGRGNASGKGTTAGRGTKGQRARTGGRNKLVRRGLKHLIERTPKTRGFRSRQAKLQIVSLETIARHFPEGAVVTPAMLVKSGLIPSSWPGVKVLGRAAIKKKMTVKADGFSAGAAEAIRQAGGTVVLLASTPAAADKEPAATS